MIHFSFLQIIFTWRFQCNWKWIVFSLTYWSFWMMITLGMTLFSLKNDLFLLWQFSFENFSNKVINKVLWRFIAHLQTNQNFSYLLKTIKLWAVGVGNRGRARWVSNLSRALSILISGPVQDGQGLEPLSQAINVLFPYNSALILFPIHATEIILSIPPKSPSSWFFE